MMEITEKRIQQLTSDLEKYVTRNMNRFYPAYQSGVRKIDLLRQGQAELLKSKVCSSKYIAQRFQGEYRQNPERALLLLICDKLHPDVVITNDGTRFRTSPNLMECRDIIWKKMIRR